MQPNGKWSKALDIVVRYGLPAASLIALLAGTFVTSNFVDLAKVHPGSSAFYLLLGEWIFPAFVGSAVIAALISLTQSIFLTPSLGNLERRNQELQGQVDLVATNLRSVFDAQMLQISNQLGVTQKDDVRVSVYAHDGEGHFLLFGRYSPNPEHRKTGRAAYPDGQGCIGKGWLNSWCFDEDVGEDTRKYNKKCKEEYGMNSDTMKLIKMRSRFFADHRVDVSANPIAVIVVESLTQARFKEADIQDVLLNAAQSIGPLVSAFRSYVPDPRGAQARGF